MSKYYCSLEKLQHFRRHIKQISTLYNFFCIFSEDDLQREEEVKTDDDLLYEKIFKIQLVLFIRLEK